MKIPEYGYWAKLIRCVDGDTFDAEVDLGFRVFTRVRFRMLNLDTPERGKLGYIPCRDELDRCIRTIFTTENSHFWIDSHKTGKYGRWLVSVPHPNGDSLPDLATLLKDYMRTNGYEKK